MEELNKEQNESVNFGAGPLLVLAGAGSGKTKVLVHRVIKLIKKDKVDGNKIILLTFTNKAAEEMRKRIKDFAGNETSIGFVGTFHSFCVKVLREFGSYISLANNFLILDTEDSESLMKSVFKELRVDKEEANPKVYLSIIGKMKNNLITAEQMLDENRSLFYRNLNKAWSVYQNKLKKNKLLDFDDILIKTVDLLRIPKVKEEINNRYQWVLVDEYQDTNKAQFELTKLLAGELKNLTVVGDASQSIYSFRGADFRNLTYLEQEYPELTRITLPKNYRSIQTILDGAYSVISNNTSHPTIRLESQQPADDRIKLVESEDEKEEAKKIVKMAINLSKEDEVGILYRVNSLSRSIEEELIKLGTAYRLVGGVRFYGRAEIKDLLAYLKLTINKEDELSLSRVKKIGIRRMSAFFDWLNEENKILDKNPGVLLNDVIIRTKYLDRFEKNDVKDESKIENIKELLAVAYEFENSLDFLENVALAESEAKKTQKSAKITLMTVHASKGLEFESVIVVGLEEGLFPHSRSINFGQKEEIEEERRLMYVAMTRAKRNLYLSFAKSRLVYGGRNRTIPSRFLGEIKNDLLERVETKENKLTIDPYFGTDRRIVEDWEVERETKSDFEEIDNW